MRLINIAVIVVSLFALATCDLDAGVAFALVLLNGALIVITESGRKASR